jgi:hypothetical protein
MFSEAGEVGVGFGGAFRAIDDEDTFEGETAFLAEGFDFFSEFAIGHGGEFVEEWQDEGRGEVGDEELEGGDEGPCPDPCVGDFLEDPEDSGEKGEADDGGEDEAFDSIYDEGSRCGFVEAEFLFDDEGMVVVEGKGDEVLCEEEDGEEDQAGEDLVIGYGFGEGFDEWEAVEEPEGEKDGEGDGGLEDREAGVGGNVGACFIEFFMIHEAFEFLWWGGGEGFQVENGGDEFEVPKDEEGGYDEDRHNIQNSIFKIQ